MSDASDFLKKWVRKNIAPTDRGRVTTQGRTTPLIWSAYRQTALADQHHSSVRYKARVPLPYIIDALNAR
jgi:hypothetical protein